MLDDFSKEEIEFFENIIPQIADSYLVGRLADIIWVLRRKFDFLRIAIANFLNIPKDESTWHASTRIIWQRILYLIMSMGSAFNAEKDIVKQDFLNIFQGFRPYQQHILS